MVGLDFTGNWSTAEDLLGGISSWKWCHKQAWNRKIGGDSKLNEKEQKWNLMMCGVSIEVRQM